MGDVQVSLLSGLFSTGLPDVWSEDTSAASENNVSASVVSLKLHTSRQVYQASHFLANKVDVIGDLLGNLVKHTLAHLNHIDNIDVTKTLDCHLTRVMLLTTGVGIEGRLI